MGTRLCALDPDEFIVELSRPSEGPDDEVEAQVVGPIERDPPPLDSPPME